MKDRILVLLDLISIIERMKFNAVAYEFLEFIIQEITRNYLSPEEIDVLDYITEKIRFLTHFASSSKWKSSPSYTHLLPPFGEIKKRPNLSDWSLLIDDICLKIIQNYWG